MNTQNITILQEENARLQTENAFLRERLKHAAYWMERQIREQALSISRRKLSINTQFCFSRV